MNVGLLKVADLSVDSTQIRADASPDRAITREQLPEVAKVNRTVREYVEQGFRTNLPQERFSRLFTLQKRITIESRVGNTFVQHTRIVPEPTFDTTLFEAAFSTCFKRSWSPIGAKSPFA